MAQGGLDKRGGSGAGRGPQWVFGVGGPRPAKRTPAQHRPRAPGSCADAIRTYCATPPRGARSHRTASPGHAHAGRGCVEGAQRRPHAQCALWQRRRAGSWGRDRRRETRAREKVHRHRGKRLKAGAGRRRLARSPARQARSSCYGFGVGGSAPAGGALSFNSELRAGPDPSDPSTRLSAASKSVFIGVSKNSTSFSNTRSSPSGISGSSDCSDGGGSWIM